MGPCNYFCDVPVYRLPEEKYYDDREAHINSTIAEIFPSPNNRSEGSKVAFLDHLQISYGGPWRFNEIIGYIRLHFLGSQIRGEYFSVRSKRVVRTRRKTLLYRTHKLAPEINIPIKSTNENIWKLIQEYLNDCSKEVKPRYVDTTVIDVMGPYVDWQKLIAAYKPRSNRSA